ncbi:MAG TPA: diaminopimelate epimerase [Planctomycetota bacterium]|nr:diaminopimelate epimerase [Planctomycetota bacterium]
MSRVRFVKMEGAGNDYLFVDAIAQAFPQQRAPELARAWSDRHFGIGADGLILLLSDADADVRMAMWNADGSRGAMCGNGLRCVAKFAYELGHARSRRPAGQRPLLQIATDAGPRAVELLLAGSTVIGARADLGRVQVSAQPERVAAGGRDWLLHRGAAGNPHAVLFADGAPESWPVLELGRALQAHAAFPGGVNVEFVRVGADGGLDQRTFERGSGETLACGTGAGVAALVALVTGRVQGPRVTVRLRGGSLFVERQGPALVLEGPARTVFSGEVELGENGTTTPAPGA